MNLSTAGEGVKRNLSQRNVANTQKSLLVHRYVECPIRGVSLQAIPQIPNCRNRQLWNMDLGNL
jgi:hypothetical protein